MNEIIQLQFYQMVAAYVFILIMTLIVKIKGIPREKQIIVASIRMTLQLVIVGYVLVYLFDNPSPYLTLFVLVLMEAFAIHNITRRANRPLSKRFIGIVALSMLLGTITCLLYFLWIVIGISPWYQPQYFIPIAGMLIGNAMTGIALGLNRLLDGMSEQRHLVEGALMLGATPRMAARTIVNQAFDAAILPTLNSMLGMGIVFLPGMMTGQILSGISPVTAIAYQIAIMLGIFGSVGLTVTLLVQLGYRTYFNESKQLILEP